MSGWTKNMKKVKKNYLIWNRYRRHSTKQAYKRYKQAGKEGWRNFEKNIVVKYRDQHKLFYSSIKVKSKVKEKIQSIRERGKNLIEDKEISEIFRELGIPTLEERREKTTTKVVGRNNIIEMERRKQLRRHSKKLRKSNLFERHKQVQNSIHERGYTDWTKQIHF